MNEINVILRASGETVTILEADFNESLHQKIEAKRSDNGATEIVAALNEMSATMVKATGEAVRSGFAEAGIGQVDRSKLAGHAGSGSASDTVTADADLGVFGRADMSDEKKEVARDVHAYGQAARTIPGWEFQYETMSEAERNVRTPEGDILTWMWARARINKDQALMREYVDLSVGGGADLSRIDQEVARQLATTPAASGGALVPQPLANAIIQKLFEEERIAPRSRQFTSVADTLRIPTHGATMVTVEAVAQNAQVPTNNPAYANVTLTKAKAGALVTSSWELTNDISQSINLSSDLSYQAAGAFAEYYDGVGAAALTAASISEVASTAGGLTRGILMAVYHALPAKYRRPNDVVWMGNDTVIEFISNLEDSTGRPLYRGTDAAAVPAGDVGMDVENIVEGRPLVRVPFATDIIIFGSLSRGYAVLRDQGIRIDVSTEAGVLWENDQVGYRFLDRRDQDVVLAEAFVKSEAVTAPA